MAVSNAIRAGRAFVELGVNSKIPEGLRAAQARLRAFAGVVATVGATMVAAGTAIVGSLFGAAKLFADVGSAAFDASRRVGISADAFTALAFAVGQAGGTPEELEVAFKQMAKVIGEASEGSKSAIAALDRIGLSAQRLLGLAPDEQFALIAEAISKIGNPTLRTAAALDIMGRSATKMIPLMEGGAAGIAAARAEAERLGVTLRDRDAVAADALGDAFGLLAAQGKAVVVAIGAALAPALTRIAAATSEVVAAVIQFVRENQALVVVAAAAGAALAAVGVALLGVAAAATVAAVAVTAFGAIAAVVASPIGIALVAVAAGLAGIAIQVTALLTAFPRLRSAIAGIFGGLRFDLQAALGAVVTFLTSGQFELAARAVAASVRSIVLQELSHIATGVTALLQSISSKFAGAFGGLAVGAKIANHLEDSDLKELIKDADEIERRNREKLDAARKSAGLSESLRGGARRDRFEQQAIVTFNPFAAGALAPTLNLRLGQIGNTVAAMSRVLEDIKKQGAKQRPPQFGA